MEQFEETEWMVSNFYCCCVMGFLPLFFFSNFISIFLAHLNTVLRVSFCDSAVSVMCHQLFALCTL